MLNARYIFVLDGESPVETEGSPTTAETVAGRDYSHGDYFDGEYQDTYIVKGQDGGFVVRKEDVVGIHDVYDDDTELTDLDIFEAR